MVLTSDKVHLPSTKTYEVGITYCDEISFTHGHQTVIEAIKEYTDMIGEALEPSNADVENMRHVRMVSLVAFNEMNEVVIHIDSGIIPCNVVHLNI